MADITVVIPVYNGERYLGAAIESILAQTVPPAEVIVVDDGSTDGSVDIAKSYGGIVRCDVGPHAGGAQALNRGIALAKRELIAFVDADDLWLPAKLRLQLAVLDARPDVQLVFGQMQQFVSPELPPADQARLAVSDELIVGRSVSALLARRAIFDMVGGLTTDLRTGWFIDWSMRASDLGVVDVVLPDLLVRRRIHGANLGLTDPEGRQDYLTLIRRNLARRRKGGA